MSLFAWRGAWQDHERLGAEARHAILRAEFISAGRGLRRATPDMLLLALLEDDTAVSVHALTAVGVNVDVYKQLLERAALTTATLDKPAMLGRSPLDAAAREAVILGVNEARRAGFAQAGAGHVLLGVLEARTGVGVRLLERRGVKLRELRDTVTALEQAGGDQTAEDFAAAFTTFLRRVGDARTCPTCHAALHASFRYCYHCGARALP